jgi:hypothetical protein
MEQIAKIERASLLTRMFFRIGERMFGLVRQVHREEVDIASPSTVSRSAAICR